MKMTDLAPVGRCIYCPSTSSLSDEHIIPFGLDGEWVLPEASCGACRDITSTLEQHVLRDMLGVPRIALGLPSRRKERRPTTLPLTIVDAGGERTIDLSFADHPTIALFPIFGPPSELTGEHLPRGIGVRGGMAAQVGGPPAEEWAERFKRLRVRTSSVYQPVSFARLLAKIAYGVAVATLGLD